MTKQSHEAWLDSILPLHSRLTSAVISISENILKAQDIDYLAVTGRTKDKSSALEKIKRKGYKEPAKQLTDLSAIRIIVFFESDVQKVSELIRKSFCVDNQNSLDKQSLLSTDQIGYRSIHFVCDLGEDRGKIAEYYGLETLKFEFQVRTVLQHAWAELAHDRGYKFSGKLPKELERKLYLYAGLLELADKGFDETSKAIDAYSDSIEEQTEKGDLNIEITSLSLHSFVNHWQKKNSFELVDSFAPSALTDLVSELYQFGIKTLQQLEEIIPENFVEKAKETSYSTTILGLIRDWMLIHDWRKFRRDVKFDWILDPNDGMDILSEYFNEDEINELVFAFNHPDEFYFDPSEL